VIRIDVHPAGGNPTNMPRTLPTPVHVRPAYTFCGQSSYVVTFYESLTELSKPTTPKKKSSRHNRFESLDRSTGPYPVSLPSQPMKQWRQSQASIDGRLLGLLGPYHQHATDTFNTCSRRSTHRSLTDIGRGYNLRGVGLPHTTHRPSQPVVSTFP
jgi:hypothetical protein